jgi:predicted transcriptional regulator
LKGLHPDVACLTLSYMKDSLTIRLDDELAAMLAKAARASGRTRSEVAREALRRQLAVVLFDQLRTRIMPFAEAQGVLTDEDLFRLVS